MTQIASMPDCKKNGAYPTLELTLELRRAIGTGKFPRAAYSIIPAGTPPAPQPQAAPSPASPTGGSGSPLVTPSSGSGTAIREAGPVKAGETPQITYNQGAAPSPQQAVGEPGGVTPAQKPIRELGPRQ